MTFINPHFLERDRQCWLRPDWRRYVRPDAARWLRPDAERRIGPQTWELKYRPDQPRVPAGNPDGGQWTRDFRSGGSTLGDLYSGLDKYDFGDLTELSSLFGLSAPEQPADDSGGALPTAINSGEGINDPRVMSDAVPDNEWIPGAQYAQRSPRRGTTSTLINGTIVEISPGEAARLDGARLEAEATTARVREIDPHWRPQPNLYETPEGLFRAYRSNADQASTRLDVLRSLGITSETYRPNEPSRSTLEILAPGGRLLGEREPGAGEGVLTIPRGQFENVRNQLMAGARPVLTRPTYNGLWFERRDGMKFGLRRSWDHGETLDIIESNEPLLERGFKWHQK